MRTWLIILACFCSITAFSQTRKTLKSLEGSRLLVRTMFETKDSLALELLFAPGMVYHVNGGILSRPEAIRTIVNNRSDFVQADMMIGGYGVTPAKDSTVVKYFYKGREHKTDGTSSPYTVNLVMVWVKQKKDVRLVRLETIKID